MKTQIEELSNQTLHEASLEYGRRLRERAKTRPMQNAEAFSLAYSPVMAHLQHETVKLVTLDAKMRVTSDNDISVGTLNASLIHPREIMRAVIMDSASTFVLLHNHPSGDPTPSQADIDITHRLLKAGEIIGIKMNDHIIIGRGSYYSFANEGLL